MKITPTIAAPQVSRILQLVPRELTQTPIASKDTYEKSQVVPISFAYDKNGMDVVTGKATDTNSVHEHTRDIIGDLQNQLHTISANADMIRDDAAPDSQAAQDATEIKIAAIKASNISKMLLNYTFYRERQP